MVLDKKREYLLSLEYRNGRNLFQIFIENSSIELLTIDMCWTESCLNKTQGNQIKCIAFRTSIVKCFEVKNIASDFFKDLWFQTRHWVDSFKHRNDAKNLTLVNKISDIINWCNIFGILSMFRRIHLFVVMHHNALLMQYHY